MNSSQLMEKVAEVAPEKYDFIVKSAEEIKRGPFREEAVRELSGILKQAADDFSHILMRGGKMLGGTAVMGVGLALAGDAYDATRRALFKTHDYRKMLDANPDLREKPAEQVQSLFSTLHKFNPEFASDPLVAGSFVRNHVDLAGGGAANVGLDSLKVLVDARKGLRESRRLPSSFVELEGGRGGAQLGGATAQRRTPTKPVNLP